MNTGRFLGILVALLFFGLLASAMPTLAAPINNDATTLDFTCADTAVHLLLSPGGGNKSWSLDGDVTDGTTYHVKTFELRLYAGDVTEPTEDPVFVFSQSYGQRVGQGDPVTCLGRFPFTNSRGTFTRFITVMATVR